LESDSSKLLRCLELSGRSLGTAPSVPLVLQSLVQNASVSELAFTHCRFRVEDEDDEPALQSLTELVRSKPNLSTLRLSLSNLFQFQQFTTAISELLVRRDSPLRCLDIIGTVYRDIEDYEDDVAVAVAAAELSAFNDTMRAVTNSARLEHLIVRSINTNNGFYQTLVQEIVPKLMVKKLMLTFAGEYDEEEREWEGRQLLEALKKNYAIQSMECTLYDVNFLLDANQARIEFFLDRNRKLEQWTKNPKLVPRELWSYAVNLAKQAGIDSLFQSLLALSGEGVGLRK